MIGDNLETDILFGINANIDSLMATKVQILILDEEALKYFKAKCINFKRKIIFRSCMI